MWSADTEVQSHLEANVYSDMRCVWCDKGCTCRDVPKRIDVLMFSAAAAAIMHCYSDGHGRHRDVFRSKYLNILDFVFGNTGTPLVPHPLKHALLLSQRQRQKLPHCCVWQEASYTFATGMQQQLRVRFAGVHEGATVHVTSCKPPLASAPTANSHTIAPLTSVAQVSCAFCRGGAVTTDTCPPPRTCWRLWPVAC